MNQALERIGESQQATCKVAMSVSLQLEREGFRAILQPNFPADNSLDAIIDFTAYHAVVNSECHRAY